VTDSPIPGLDPARLRFGHTSEDTAYVVNNYPCGRRVRTRIRYWIETTAYGDRFCAQTLNPKTSRWNAPKRGTYTGVAVLTVDAGQRVGWVSLRENDSAAWIDHFVDIVGRERLSERQLDRLNRIIGYTRGMAGVTFRTVETTGWSADQLAAHAAEQARQEAGLRRLIASETRLAGVPGARAQERPRTNSEAPAQRQFAFWPESGPDTPGIG